MEERRAQELLARERARVEAALADLDRGDRSDEPDPFDPADAAPDLLEAEIEEGLADRLQEELEAIERAEQRLAEGVYGRSVESGEPIPDARLEAIPWAERTASEQARHG
ncbi:MAG TPA: TraR/DksA C4-type zinc finger protein [Solirubrobacteraceae bacterium]|nr:TraR/DksA C4-type zinc finger protein [Solirubrobacteraceae bacterium]